MDHETQSTMILKTRVREQVAILVAELIRQTLHDHQFTALNNVRNSKHEPSLSEQACTPHGSNVNAICGVGYRMQSTEAQRC